MIRRTLSAVIRRRSRLALGAALLLALGATGSYAQSSADGTLAAGLYDRVGAAARAARFEVAGRELRAPGLVSRFYAARSFEPGWIDANGRPDAGAARLVEHLAMTAEEGLDAERYHASELAARTTGGTTPRDLLELDLLLTDAWLTLATDRMHGAWREADPAPWEGAAWPARDPVTLLDGALRDGQPVVLLASLEPALNHYRRLRNALAQYRDLAGRTLPPPLASGTALRLGDDDPRVIVLRQRLQFYGDLEADNDAQQTRFDGRLDAAVLGFQARHGLEADGIFGRSSRAALNVSPAERAAQIELNLERLRWLPPQLEARHLWLNLAAGQLRLVNGEASGFERQITVGRDCRAHPSGRSIAMHVTLDPEWSAPPGSVTQSLLGVARSDSARFTGTGYRIVQGWGDAARVRDPAAFDWPSLRSENPDIRILQAAGPANPLAGLRMITSSSHGLLLHGARAPGEPLDDAAHAALNAGDVPGCVGLTDPRDFVAALLTNDAGDTVLPSDGNDSRQVQRTYPLQPVLPVYVTYLTAWVDDQGVLQFRGDRFGRDRALEKRRR